MDELNKHGLLQISTSSPTKPVSSPTSPIAAFEPDLNQSICSSNGNRSFRAPFLPDVSGIISLIEDQSLLSFVNEKNDESTNETINFNLNECLEKLKVEADSLLQLSEKMQKRFADNKDLDEKNKSFEEEDGLKCVKGDFNADNLKQRVSLPAYLPSDKSTELSRKTLSHSDLNDLKNRLVVAEIKNQELEKKLAESLAHQNELTLKLNSYLDGQSEELSEG